MTCTHCPNDAIEEYKGEQLCFPHLRAAVRFDPAPATQPIARKQAHEIMEEMHRESMRLANLLKGKEAA